MVGTVIPFKSQAHASLNLGQPVGGVLHYEKNLPCNRTVLIAVAVLAFLGFIFVVSIAVNEFPIVYGNF
jgi:hypothetical protein